MFNEEEFYDEFSDEPEYKVIYSLLDLCRKNILHKSEMFVKGIYELTDANVELYIDKKDDVYDIIHKFSDIYQMTEKYQKLDSKDKSIIDLYMEQKSDDDWRDKCRTLFDDFNNTVRLIENIYGEISVKGTQYEGRPERIEKVQKGDDVLLVREPGNAHDSNAIDVRNAEGSLGHLDANFSKIISSLIDSGKAECTAKVSNVVPLSKLSSRSKNALLAVKIEVNITESLNADTNVGGKFTVPIYSTNTRLTINRLSFVLPDGYEYVSKEHIPDNDKQAEMLLSDYAMVAIPKNFKGGFGAYSDASLGINLSKPENTGLKSSAWDDRKKIKQAMQNSAPSNVSFLNEGENFIIGYCRGNESKDSNAPYWVIYGVFILVDTWKFDFNFYFNSDKTNNSDYERVVEDFCSQIEISSSDINDSCSKAAKDNISSLLAKNGKLNGVLASQLYSKDVIFNNENEVMYIDNHTHITGVQLNAQVIYNYPIILNNSKSFVYELMSLYTFVEKNESLMIPKSRFHSEILKATRNNPITGLTFFEFCAWHMLIITDNEPNEYMVAIDCNLINGIPDAFSFVGEFIRTLRQYNDITDDFKVDFVSVLNADGPCQRIMTPVSGAASGSMKTITVSGKTKKEVLTAKTNYSDCSDVSTPKKRKPQHSPYAIEVTVFEEKIVKYFKSCGELKTEEEVCDSFELEKNRYDISSALFQLCKKNILFGIDTFVGKVFGLINDSVEVYVDEDVREKTKKEEKKKKDDTYNKIIEILLDPIPKMNVERYPIGERPENSLNIYELNEADWELRLLTKTQIYSILTRMCNNDIIIRTVHKRTTFYSLSPKYFEQLEQKRMEEERQRLEELKERLQDSVEKDIKNFEIQREKVINVLYEADKPLSSPEIQAIDFDIGKSPYWNISDLLTKLAFDKVIVQEDKKYGQSSYFLSSEYRIREKQKRLEKQRQELQARFDNDIEEFNRQRKKLIDVLTKSDRPLRAPEIKQIDDDIGKSQYWNIAHLLTKLVNDRVVIQERKSIYDQYYYYVADGQYKKNLSEISSLQQKALSLENAIKKVEETYNQNRHNPFRLKFAKEALSDKKKFEIELKKVRAEISELEEKTRSK